jgi:hypothetical protein
MRGVTPLLLMRRTVLLLAAVVALALVVLAIGVTPKKADAGPRFVTRTLGTAEQITIPAGAPTATAGSAAPYPSDVNVGAFPRGSAIVDVNLTLRNYTHTFPDDVDVLLKKAGTNPNRTVMSDAGGGNPGVDNITLVLDDEAANPLPDNSPPVGGRFRPANYEGADFFPAPAPPSPNPGSNLSGFDGRNPNGTWRIFVRDDAGTDVGRFAGGWTITIKARVPN